MFNAVILRWSWLACTDRATLSAIVLWLKPAKGPSVPLKNDARATYGLFIWEAGRDVCRTGRLTISLCMYISLTCPIPFMWKEFCLDVFPGKAGSWFAQPDPGQATNKQTNKQTIEYLRSQWKRRKTYDYFPTYER